MTGIDRVYQCVCECPSTCRDVADEVFGSPERQNVKKSAAYLATLAQRGKVRVSGQVESIHWYQGQERSGRFMKIYEAVA